MSVLKSCVKWRWKKSFFFLKKSIMNFKKAAETFSIVSCSTRDTSPRDLCIMTLSGGICFNIFLRYLTCYTFWSIICSEAGSAFLIHFQFFFLNKVFLSINSENSNFMPEWIYLVVKVSKRAKKSWKKPQFGVISVFSEFFLPWLIWYISIAILWEKKMWCHYISLGVIFSHLVKLRHHFQIYSQQLSTTS